MTWKVKEKDKKFIVFKPNSGSFNFNNKFDAERLCDKLNSFNDHWGKISEKLIQEGEALIDLGNELKEVGEK